jgi:phosphate transport system ATP-binding protein
VHVSLDGVSVKYGSFTAVRDVSFDVPRNEITALIGPSGCGKSTLLRTINRMNDLVPTASVDGHIHYNGEDIYADGVDPVEVRRRIGMVFQKPNPFPKSIYDNVAFGPRLNGFKGDLDALVERACARPRCGTRSRASSPPAGCRCPAASSSACASPGPSRSSRT